MPRIDDSLDALRESIWFSTLDLASAYNQVEVVPEDREKTAFSTQCGLYEFKVMSFGLCNAPATFERLMELVLHGLHWKICLIYLDDVIVTGKSFDEHIQNLKEVLSRIEKSGLKVSPNKCCFFTKEVTFVGHIVSDKGISTDPKKIEAVKTWPQPKNVREIRSFLGLCSYYRRFVKDFASVAKPLHNLTEKQVQFRWTVECQTAFELLKSSLTSTPILCYPSTRQQFILDTDASGCGIGAVLAQFHEGREQVVAYFSRVLSKAERNYCVTRRELLAVIESVKHFHHYVYGVPFTVRTDHGALTWLLRFKNIEGQMARWLEILNAYDFKIIHRPGKQHKNADSLLRRPCEMCNY